MASQNEEVIREMASDIREIMVRLEGLPDLVRRVEELERSDIKRNAWAAGAGALMTGILWLAARLHIFMLPVFLLSCAAPATLPADGHFYGAHPRRVLLAGDLPDCEALTMIFAVEFWRDLGVDDLTIVPVPADHLAVLGLTQPGDIVVTADPVMAPKELGVTLQWVSKDGFLHSSNIRQAVCNIRVAAHELGHALGIPHNNIEGSLMFPVFEKGGWLVTGQEREWAR